MTIHTPGRQSLKSPIGMTCRAFRRLVHSCKRKCRVVMVKYIVLVPRWMTPQTSWIVVHISLDLPVLFIHLWIFVAIGTAKDRYIIGIRVAIRTGAPLSFMFAGIDRKIFAIVVKGRGPPFGLGVTHHTICREFGRGVIGIGRVIVILAMTSYTLIGRVGVVAIMALDALHGNRSMCTLQNKEIIVIVKTSRLPLRIRRMTGSTIRGQIQLLMLRIGGLVIILVMTGDTIRRRPRIPVGMTIYTISLLVGTCQRKSRIVVVKYIVRIPGRMTPETGLVSVKVIRDTFMLVIRLRIGVTGDARKEPIIRRIFMTIDTCIPLPFVLAGIDRKILAIMIKRRWRPGILRMARTTILGELRLDVIGILRGIVLGFVAPKTSIRRIVVPRRVALGTIFFNQRVGSTQFVIIVVNIKLRRLPPHVGRMTSGTIHRKIQSLVSRLFGLYEIVGMAGFAIRRSIRIIIGHMTPLTILDVVPQGQWEKVVIDLVCTPPYRRDIVALQTVL